MHIAARRGHTNVLHVLLAHGVDVDIPARRAMDTADVRCRRAPTCGGSFCSLSAVRM